MATLPPPITATFLPNWKGFFRVYFRTWSGMPECPPGCPFHVEERTLKLCLSSILCSFLLPCSAVAGVLVPLEEQDRSRWSRPQIDEGLEVLDHAVALARRGPYQVQAAIVALHARAATPADTDWRQIAALYGTLSIMHPSPVVQLNHAVAVAMAEGPAVGLRLLDALEQSGTLRAYHLLPAARADLHRRAGQRSEAARAYEAAIALTTNEGERAYLRRRLVELAH